MVFDFKKISCRFVQQESVKLLYDILKEKASSAAASYKRVRGGWQMAEGRGQDEERRTKKADA